MEKAQGSKLRRVYSLTPKAIMLTNFSHKYVTYLLPALLRVGTVTSCRGNHKARDVRKMVRFEVDMALVFSASGFAWSRALKRQLEQGMNIKVLSNYTHRSQHMTSDPSLLNVVELFDELWALPAITRPLVPVKLQIKPKPRLCQHKTMRKKMARGEELGYRVRTLRRILPGGNEMSVFELLSEVESYVVCLELQVSILRSLLDAR